ncbi:hypothetical protein [Streptomyces sp. NPDC088847]|uniref:hypothetical protein n=1 Tax=Streptomyces sp. NPDC088847 TaxID=3365909 RepID=UPI00382F749A
MTTHQIAVITTMITAIATLLQAMAAFINAIRKDRDHAPQSSGANSGRERERSASGDE